MTIPAKLSIPASPDLASMPGPFEGPEKLLEIWFAPSVEAACSTSRRNEHLAAGSSSGGRLRPRANNDAEWKGLRKVPREVWEEMLDIVKCKVLSVVEGDELDAYLLSCVTRLLGSQVIGADKQRVVLVRCAAFDHPQDVRNDAQPAGPAPDHRDCAALLRVHRRLEVLLLAQVVLLPREAARPASGLAGRGGLFGHHLRYVNSSPFRGHTTVVGLHHCDAS